MLPKSLPRVFDLLIGRPNIAVDAALVEALTHLEEDAQGAALKMLIRRAHAPSLSAVVGCFHEADNGLKELIVRHAAELAVPIREAITCDSFDDRSDAIEIIVGSDDGPSAYLLADAIRSQCPRTRALAASGLREMTAHYLDRIEAGPTPDEAEALSAQADNLAKALHRAVQGWEVHMQPQLLEAALWMGDHLEATVRQKLRDPHNRIVGAINNLLETTSEPRLAGFLVQALAIPEFRDSAVSAISGTIDLDFVRAIIAQSSRLENDEIRRGWRWIRDCKWLHQSVDVLIQLEEPWAEPAVRLLAGSGGPQDRRMQIYRGLLNGGCNELRQAVLEQLVADPSEPATTLLVSLAGRAGDDLSPIAARELKRRCPDAVATLPDQSARSSGTPEPPTGDGDALGNLRAGLAGADPLERAEALRRLRAMGKVKPLAELVYRLTHDPEPMVRSQAVAMLSDIPGPTTERILRAAVNDPDERVQANAIEALDRLDLPDRGLCTEQKLKSRANRVRANAIKSLLRTELHKADEALLDMLDDSSQPHRLSALWVVERLRMQIVLGRVHEMSRDDPDRRVRARAGRLLREFCADGATGSWWHDIVATGTSDDLAGGSA